MSSNYAIILSAGSGNRIRKNIPKAFLKIHDMYMLEYSIKAFSETKEIHHIILVVPKDYLETTQQLINEKAYTKVTQILAGGDSRFQSSQKGLSVIPTADAHVLIHDAARPFVSKRIINDCIESLKHHDAVNVLSPVSDTLVKIEKNIIKDTVDRNTYRQTQTPQGFKLAAITKAHQLAVKENMQDITDDFGLVLKYNTGNYSWVNGSLRNFKITYAEDLEFAKICFGKQNTITLP